MKTIFTKTVIGLTLILTTALVNAQAPFGGPPSEVQQPQTSDIILGDISSTNINVEPSPDLGGGGGGDCDLSIIRTGNDMQYFYHSNGTSIAKVSVWDGCDPSFHFSFYPDPYTTSATRQANVDLRGASSVYDPDVILTQNIVGEISILIVYQYGGEIAFEQWDYNYNLNQLTLNTPAASTAPFVYTIGEGQNPNIAGNNNNEIAIVYQKEDIISPGNTKKYIVTQVSNFSSPTTFNNEIQISDCIDPQNDPDYITPDVSISDYLSIANKSVVSYVMIDIDNNNKLYLRQNTFDNLSGGSPPPCNFDEIDIRAANPRVSSPRTEHLSGSNNLECAITAERILEDDDGSIYNLIRLYPYYGPASFGIIDLNYDPDPAVSKLVPLRDNTYPAITYCDQSKVSVAWTFLNPAGSIEKQDVISVNYNFQSNVRTPTPYEYFMLVNFDRDENQHAASVSNLLIDGENLPVYYTFADTNYKKTVKVKTSNTSMQPFIRKKSIVSEENQPQNEILIYPNPSSGQINLDIGDMEIESSINVKIYSIEGKIVFEKFGTKSTFNKPMNINNLDKGVYLMEYKYGENIERKKIILQ